MATDFSHSCCSLFRHVPDTHLPSLSIALAVLVIIVGFDIVAPRFPGALLAVIGMIAASAAFHWKDRGIGVVGAVPSGLPRHLAVQRRMTVLLDVAWTDITLVLLIAYSCFIVILAQSQRPLAATLSAIATA